MLLRITAAIASVTLMSGIAMADLVRTIATTRHDVLISDYLTDPANPTTTNYRVTIGEVTDTPSRNGSEYPLLPDIDNSDIYRRRILIDYSYVLRG